MTRGDEMATIPRRHLVLMESAIELSIRVCRQALAKCETDGVDPTWLMLSLAAIMSDLEYGAMRIRQALQTGAATLPRQEHPAASEVPERHKEPRPCAS